MPTMNTPLSWALRSVLFAPAVRADLLRKLPRSRPDAAIIDLEDGVPPSGKEAARTLARTGAEELAQSHPWLRLFVRVNAVSTQWFAEDIAHALTPRLAGVVLPKYESSEQFERLSDALEAQGLKHLAVLVGIETVAGVERVGHLLQAPMIGAYFGAEDFIADLGGERTEEGLEVLYARSRVAIAARLAGVSALDQVVVTIHDEHKFMTEAAQARALGYRGKLCIHPAQVPLANRAFSPNQSSVQRAHQLLDAYSQAVAEGKGVIVFEGQMVDQPMVTQAQAVLARAQKSGADSDDASQDERSTKNE